MSGSGVFLLGKNGTVALRSIVYKAVPTNKFECIKIDEILDQINETLSEFELDNIQTTTNSLSINDETFNLADLADIKNIRNFITNTSKLNGNEITTPDDIREKAKELNKRYNDNKQIIDDLSYQYAHLALLAHDKKMQLAKNRFFKRAIILNPNHITAFSLEKSEHQKNKTAQEINDITPTDANGIHKKYNQLIDLENNDRNKIRLIKEAINNLSYFDDTPENRIFIDAFAVKLDKLYEQEKTIKVVFKYQDLADFYHGIPQKYSLALYYNQLSLEIINLFTNPKLYNDISSKIVQKINSLEKLEHPLSSDKIIEIKNKAKTLLSEEEDKGIKEILDKISHEIFTLRSKDHEQKEITKEIIESLISLHIQNHNIASYTMDNKIDIDISNKNNSEIKESTNAIKEIIRKIPEKYNIQVDEKTRTELSSIIEEPAETIRSTLNKINVIVDNTERYIKTSDESLKILVKHEQEGLALIHKNIQGGIDTLSQQQDKLKIDKNEVLEFLKASELRVLAKIYKLDISTQRKNKTIDFIREKISQLQKLVNTATIIQSNNHSDIIKSANNTTKDLKQIIITCQELEKSVLGQLKNTLDYTDDITMIKRSQNRFEHSLLNQTKNAFANYEKITEYSNIRPSLSFGQKVLLSIYFIIMTACAIYFIVNYSLLDLLTSLWHTA